MALDLERMMSRNTNVNPIETLIASQTDASLAYTLVRHAGTSVGNGGPHYDRQDQRYSGKERCFHRGSRASEDILSIYVPNR